MKNIINILKVNKNAVIPQKMTVGSAGVDLYACISESISVSFGELVKIPCGIAIELPSPNYSALIFARSGLGIKYGIMPSNGVGVIDSDYRGEIQVGLCKVSKGSPYVIKNRDRVAQLVIIKLESFYFNEINELSITERNDKGLGSSGR